MIGHPAQLIKVMDNVLDSFRENYKKNRKISDEDLISLYHVFGPIVESALELVETGSVRRLFWGNVCIEPHLIHEVIGTSGNTSYHVLDGINICKCDAFLHYVLMKKSRVTCKHILACRLAAITGHITSYQVLPREQMNNILLSFLMP